MESEKNSVLNLISFSHCVLELVLNSLNAQASSVAIRLSLKKRKIQVVDNGVGLSKDALQYAGEYNATNNEIQCKNSLSKICYLSEALVVASRHKNSEETYMKIFKESQAVNFIEVERRPSHGTTVTVYNFCELSQSESNIYEICSIITSLASVHLKTSFSIKDEDQNLVVLQIKKPHSAEQVLKLLCGKQILSNCMWEIKNNEVLNIEFIGYIGITTLPITQQIFLNGRPVQCPLIKNLISNSFINVLNLQPCFLDRHNIKEEMIFIIMFFTCPSSEFSYTHKDGQKYIMFYRFYDLQMTIRKCIINIFAKKDTYLFNSDFSEPTVLEKSSDTSHKNTNQYKFPPINDTKLSTFNNGRRPSPINIMLLLFSMKRKIINEEEFNLYMNAFKKLLNIEIYNNKKYLRHDSETRNNFVDTEKMSIEKIKIEGQNAFEIKQKLRIEEAEENNIIDMEINDIISQWSHWSYHSKPQTHLQAPKNNVFNFLPPKLHSLLQFGNNKLTKMIKLTHTVRTTISKKLKFGSLDQANLYHHEIDIRPCKFKEQIHEFKLEKHALKHLKILNQVNKEFIAAIISENNFKILMFIDQHAVDERIRYETLLREYRPYNDNKLLSANLKEPIRTEFPPTTCDLLLRNKTYLENLGITFSLTKANIITVHSVPKCLKKSRYYDSLKMISTVRNLLCEIIQNLESGSIFNNLPFTIHNAIATEACHGAIKFGDPLTLEQCKWLVKLLEYTKCPTRCAHGRPSMVPIMQLPDRQDIHGNIVKKKLNFASLRAFRQRKHARSGGFIHK